MGVGFVEGGGEFGLERDEDGPVGNSGAGEGLAGDAGGDLESASDLGQRHLFDVFVAEVFEETMDGPEKLLGRVPFVLAIVFGSASPVSGLFSAQSGLGFSLMLKEAGVEGLDTVEPTKSAGPFPHGVEFLIELIGDGLEGAAVAEVEEGHEGAEGARGFAGEVGEGRRLSVES